MSAPAGLPGVEVTYSTARRELDDAAWREWQGAALDPVEHSGPLHTVRRVDLADAGCDCGFVGEGRKGCAACRGGRR